MRSLRFSLGGHILKLAKLRAHIGAPLRELGVDFPFFKTIQDNHNFWIFRVPMTASADRVQGIFNRIAPVYDDLNDWLSLGLHRVWKQMTVKWSGAKPGDRALDLCCGSGDLALRLAAAVGRRETGAAWGGPVQRRR